MGGIEITVNGEARRFPAPLGLRELLLALRLEPASVAVERNGQIVPRAELASLALADGDRLEIVRLVGGG